MLFRDYKIVLKMEKERLDYIRQVPSAHSAYWLYILKVSRWNNIFDTLLNPLSGQPSSEFYFCTLWSGSELCLNEDRAHESDQKSLFWRSFQSGDRFAPARPHFVTWPLRDQWHPSEGQMAGVRVCRADGDNSLVPTGTESTSYNCFGLEGVKAS